MMKKILKYFFGLIIVSILLFAFYLWRNSSTSHDSNKVLLDRYPNGFVTKSIKIGDTLVAFSFDNYGWQNTDEPNYNSPPIAYLLKDGVINDAHEIVFEEVAFTNENRFLRLDVNNDGRDEIISKWSGHSMLGDGFRGLVVWSLKDGKLVALAGYP